MDVLWVKAVKNKIQSTIQKVGYPGKVGKCIFVWIMWYILEYGTLFCPIMSCPYLDLSEAYIGVSRACGSAKKSTMSSAHVMHLKWVSLSFSHLCAYHNIWGKYDKVKFPLSRVTLKRRKQCDRWFQEFLRLGTILHMLMYIKTEQKRQNHQFVSVSSGDHQTVTSSHSH